MSLTIDVHHHIRPDFFLRATNDLDNPVGGITPAPWSKEAMLSYMDDAGTNIAVTSVSTPGVHMGDDAAAREPAAFVFSNVEFQYNTRLACCVAILPVDRNAVLSIGKLLDKRSELRKRQIVMVFCYARSELNRLYQGIHRCLNTVGVQMR